MSRVQPVGNLRYVGNLSDRERIILRMIIHLYILKGSPIGSRTLSKYLSDEIKLSPASIRLVMADLEEKGFIAQPHASAGRVPTDAGYRFYVDTIIDYERLSRKEIKALQKALSEEESAAIYANASKILSALSKSLGIVAFPYIQEAKIVKIELLPLSSDRILVVLALDSNVAQTAALEAEIEIDEDLLSRISDYLNEKISGKPLKFIRENFGEIIDDFEFKETPVVRLFLDSVDRIFREPPRIKKVNVAGAYNLLEYPEYDNAESLRGIIEILENEDAVIHLIERIDEPNQNLIARIGSELPDENLSEYSVILAKYATSAGAEGSLGIIGPKRMKYEKMFSLVQRLSEFLSARL